MAAKANFGKLVRSIYVFEKEARFTKTSEKKLLGMLKEEIKTYEHSRSAKIKANKLMDMIILIFQIARRTKVSLDKEWAVWWKKSEKYLNKNKN